MKLHSKIILDLLRVKQWIKNLLVYVALVFTNNLFNQAYFIKVTIGFFLLSFAASALYILNDIKDYKEDRFHPDKKTRPIASGAVRKDFGFAISALLIIISLTGSFILEQGFFRIVLSYIILSLLYTMKLKHAVILDVFIVAALFVLRAIAGAFVINASISPWLIIVTSLLALLVIMAKRRYELSELADPSKHRKVLNEYSVSLLDEMISISAASTVIAYSLYTFTSETAAQHQYLMLTIPFVLYGIFRYLYLMHKKNLGGSPELIFLKDWPMIVNIGLCFITIVIIIYFAK